MKVTEKDLTDSWNTQEVQQLIEAILIRYTKKGSRVLDPFCGSGSIPIIADKMGRLAFCCDFSDKYVRICQKRGIRSAIRCDAGKLSAYPTNSMDIIITSPPTISHGERYSEGEPAISNTLPNFLSEAKRIMRGNRIVIIGAKEDAEIYHDLCKRVGLALTFVALPIDEKYEEAKI